jgi:thiol-disulfide isomerase/thioredoxin
MITLLFILSSLFYSFDEYSQTNNPTIIKFDSLDKLMSESGKIRVINFWATWCGPCVKEIPNFEKANQHFVDKNVEITLVSLDFANEFDKVVRFIERKNIKSSVLLLDEIDYNSWIDKVSEDWSGAIPATLLIDQENKKYLKEGEMNEEELFEFINEHIN